MIRWGIIGLGRISVRFMEGLSYCEDGMLYAAASRTKKTRDAFLIDHPNVKVYGDYDELLDDPMIDAVYIALRHKDHYEWSKKALLKKKAVLCEKPATLFAYELEDLINISKLNHVFYMEAMKSRFIPLMDELKKTIINGDIGDIVRIETSFCNNVPYDEKSYFFNQDQGGALYDVAIYNIASVFDFISSQVKDIQLEQIRNYGVDVYNAIEVTFESGQTALIECALDRTKEKKMTITGTKGSIECIPFYRPTQATITVGDDVYLMEKDYIYDDFYTEIMAVHEALYNCLYEHPRMSHADSLRCIQFLENAVKLGMR